MGEQTLLALLTPQSAGSPSKPRGSEHMPRDPPPSVTIRHAVAEDCHWIAAVYNEGIIERSSTFETEPRTGADIADWMASIVPVLVAERDSRIVGWARVSPYSTRPCYAGIAEGSVYVTKSQRGRGIGSALVDALRREAETANLHKILGKILVDNDASRRLVQRFGFREVGVHRRHGRLDGTWRDVLLVELLLDEGTG